METQLIKSREFKLLQDLTDPLNPSSDNIYLYGPNCCGKSYLINKLLQSFAKDFNIETIKIVQINGLDFNLSEKDAKSIYDYILINVIDYSDNLNKTDDFLTAFFKSVNNKKLRTIYLIFDNAEKIKPVCSNLVAVLEDMNNYIITNKINLNIINVFISTIPQEKMFGNYCPLDLFPMYITNFSESEIIKIILNKCVDGPFSNYYQFFVQHMIKGCFSQCTNINELNYIIKINWEKLTSLLDSSRQYKDWDLLTISKDLLKNAVSNLYLRQTNETRVNKSISNCSLQLPYFGRFLLIAAYIASYNSKQSDRTLFVSVTDKLSRRSKILIKKQEKPLNCLLGPRPFTLDRLFAIFSSIVEDVVEDSLLNVSRLVHSLVAIKLLVSSTRCNSDALNSRKYKCVASFETVMSVAHTVHFDLKKYLTDFIGQ